MRVEGMGCVAVVRLRVGARVGLVGFELFCRNSGLQRRAHRGYS